MMITLGYQVHIHSCSQRSLTKVVFSEVDQTTANNPFGLCDTSTIVAIVTTPSSVKRQDTVCDNRDS